MENINLCSKERPYTFDQMVGQEAVVNNIRQQAKAKKFFQCYILEGQFGSGKTTMARILSRAVNCENPDEHGNPCGCCASCRAVGSGSQDVIELDAASNTGVDSIREIKDSVEFLPIELKKKVYIIDEVHKLSDSAFNALLKVLEEPPEHVVFILCTTEMKKIPATIRSRAACYHFAQIKQSDITKHLTALAEKYQFTYTPEGVELIAMNAAGSMRNALKLLEQTAQSELGVTEESVRQMLGLTDPTDLFAIIDALVQGNAVGAVRFIRSLLSGGVNPLSMVSDLLDICADAVVRSSTKEELDRNTEHYREMLYGICEDVSADVFCRITNGLLGIYQKLQQNADEATLICGLIAMSSTSDGIILQLEEKVRSLEEKVSDLMQGVCFKESAGDSKSDSMDQLIRDSLTEAAETCQAPTELTENVLANVKQELFESKETEEKVGFQETKTDAVNEVSTDMDTVSPTQEDEKETELPTTEGKRSEPKPVDPFTLLGMFGFNKKSSPVKAPEIPKPKTAAPVKETVQVLEKTVTPSEESKPVKESNVEAKEELPKETQTLPAQEVPRGEVVDATGLFMTAANSDDGFRPVNDETPFDDAAVFEGSAVSENTDAAYVPARTSGDVDVFLSQFYQAHPFMESVLELGFKRSEVDGTTEYATDMNPMWRIAKAYGEIFDFPFALRKEA